MKRRSTATIRCASQTRRRRRPGRRRRRRRRRRLQRLRDLGRPDPRERRAIPHQRRELVRASRRTACSAASATSHSTTSCSSSRTTRSTPRLPLSVSNLVDESFVMTQAHMRALARDADLLGLSHLELVDEVIARAARHGLLIMLDVHRLTMNDGEAHDAYWYDATCGGQARRGVGDARDNVARASLPVLRNSANALPDGLPASLRPPSRRVERSRPSVRTSGRRRGRPRLRRHASWVRSAPARIGKAVLDPARRRRPSRRRVRRRLAQGVFFTAPCSPSSSACRPVGQVGMGTSGARRVLRHEADPLYAVATAQSSARSTRRVRHSMWTMRRRGGRHGRREEGVAKFEGARLGRISRSCRRGARWRAQI